MDKINCFRKLISYEETIFQEYLSKRNQLKSYLETVSQINENELLVFVNDLKAIVDPIKTSTLAIDHCLNNSDFKNTQSISDQNELQKMFFYYTFLTMS